MAFSTASSGYGSCCPRRATRSRWRCLAEEVVEGDAGGKVTDVTVPPADVASDDVKKLQDTLQRGLADEQVAQYVTKIESEIGTTINQAAFAQVTGANNN